MTRCWRSIIACSSICCLTLATDAKADETLTFAYDARGRLVQVSRTGSINNGLVGIYAYDKADNRLNVTVVAGGTSNSWRAGDINGDGRDDILWHHNESGFSDWLGLASGGFVNNDANAWRMLEHQWHVSGLGDFNGDGRDDVLLRDYNGTITNWLGQANGGFAINDANAWQGVPTSWRVVGTGDFNGDGRSDILWRNSDGTLTNWLGTSAGGFISNYGIAATSVPTEWHVVGVGDFNGDGRDDVLWRHNLGELSNWLGQTNGGFVNNGSNSGAVVDNTWKVVGVGDFNGDNRGDILWRNDSGALTNWLGTTSGGFADNGSNASYQVATNWRIVATGDYNGDGRDDILWRNSTGTISNWLATSSGAYVNNDANALSDVPTSWHVEPR